MNYAHSNSQNIWAGVTGTQFEEEFIKIASVKVTWFGQYIPYDASMRIVRKAQAPNSALNDEGLKFRNEIARQMQISPDELSVYGSLKTCLDEKHGVDLFIDWNGITVTVDLTMNPNKTGYKADVVVAPSDVNDGYTLAADRVAWAFRQGSRPSLRAS